MHPQPPQTAQHRPPAARNSPAQGEPSARHGRPDPPGAQFTEPDMFATVPVSLLGAAHEQLAPAPAQLLEERAAELREKLRDIRASAEAAASWLETTHHYARLINGDGFVPVTARFRARDLEFLGRARENLVGFAEVTLRLVELHQPLDAGGISSDPASPVLRCRSCMWRWPCPSLRIIMAALDDSHGQLVG